MIRNKLINIKSKRLFNEMKTFVWVNGKPQAMRKHNDDLIMACAIACWIKETAFATNQGAAAYQKAFLSSNAKLNTSIPGMIAYKKVKKEQNEQNYIENAWLLKG